MNITVKLFSYFSQLLPKGTENYAVAVEAAAGARVRDVLTPFGVPLKECRLIILNGTVRTDTEYALDMELTEGDTVAILPNVH
ncbi:MAG: hypothetical protein HQ504_04855 [Rhodospirillaceae bacterium]|nr:hypothetical protein [Rhodospirillaceae bacterium]